MDTIYLTLCFNQGFSSLGVKEYLKSLSLEVFPARIAGRQQTWRLKGNGLSIEYVEDTIIENLPLEWPLIDAFVSDRRGEEVYVKGDQRCIQY